MNIFEGYVGIRLWDEQLVDDVIFLPAVISVCCFFFCIPGEFSTVCEDVERCFPCEGKAESF